MFARARAVSGLGNGQAVRIVSAADFAFKGAAQVFVKGFSVQPGRICIFHETGSRGNCPRDSHADGGGAAKLFFHFLYALSDGADRAFVVEARSRDAMAVEFGAVALERDKFNFCATQVHANAKGVAPGKNHSAGPLSNAKHSNP